LSEDLLPIAKAAKLLGVSPITLRRWDAQGVLSPDFRTLGGSRRYSKKRLQEILRNRALPKGEAR